MKVAGRTTLTLDVITLNKYVGGVEREPGAQIIIPRTDKENAPLVFYERDTVAAPAVRTFSRGYVVLCNVPTTRVSRKVQITRP